MNWRMLKARIQLRRKCSRQFNKERTQWRSVSAGQGIFAIPTPQSPESMIKYYLSHFAFLREYADVKE